MERGISGTHRMNGIFMAYGAGVQPGTQTDEATLLDLAPTILHLMSAPIPGRVDGRVLHEIISPDFQTISAVHGNLWSQPDTDVENGDGLSEEQKRVVAERLRGLGYVG